jgi:hypothetical protein
MELGMKLHQRKLTTRHCTVGGNIGGNRVHIFRSGSPATVGGNIGDNRVNIFRVGSPAKTKIKIGGNYLFYILQAPLVG